MARRPARAAPPPSGLPGALRCRRKFLRQFPGGFCDPTYLDWERDYKWETHLRWRKALLRLVFGELLRNVEYAEAASRVMRVEQRSRHAMLFSFEKMGLRDTLCEPEGAVVFAEGLYDFLHGPGGDVPPPLSSTVIWSPIPQHKEIGRGEAFLGRTDHRLPAGSRSGHGGQGAVPTARVQRRLVLPVAQQVRRDGGGRCQALA